MKITRNYLKKLITESISQLNLEAESPEAAGKKVDSSATTPVSLTTKTNLFKAVVGIDHLKFPINGVPLASSPQFSSFVEDYKKSKSKYLVFLQSPADANSFTLHEVIDPARQLIGPALGNGATINIIALRSSGIFAFKGDVPKMS